VSAGRSDNGFDAEEQAALHGSLRESVEQMHRDQLVDADVARAELHAHG